MAISSRHSKNQKCSYVLKKEEQEKRIELGEEIPEEELIKEPEPYEERLYKLDEFEELLKTLLRIDGAAKQ